MKYLSLTYDQGVYFQLYKDFLKTKLEIADLRDQKDGIIRVKYEQ